MPRNQALHLNDCYDDRKLCQPNGTTLSYLKSVQARKSPHNEMNLCFTVMLQFVFTHQSAHNGILLYKYIFINK